MSVTLVTARHACVPHPSTKHHKPQDRDSPQSPQFSLAHLPLHPLSPSYIQPLVASAKESNFIPPLPVGPLLMLLAPTFRGKSVLLSLTPLFSFPPHSFSRCQRKVLKAPSSRNRNGS